MGHDGIILFPAWAAVSDVMIMSARVSSEPAMPVRPDSSGPESGFSGNQLLLTHCNAAEEHLSFYTCVEVRGRASCIPAQENM